jgi:hypothetical protein
VTRWNKAAVLPRTMYYAPSAAVSRRSLDPNHDLVVEVRRDPAHLVLALRRMNRTGRPDALMIEGAGAVGVHEKRERFDVRLEPLPTEKTSWRLTISGQKFDGVVDELPERLVAAIGTGELKHLRGDRLDERR